MIGCATQLPRTPGGCAGVCGGCANPLFDNPLFQYNIVYTYICFGYLFNKPVFFYWIAYWSSYWVKRIAYEITRNYIPKIEGPFLPDKMLPSAILAVSSMRQRNGCAISALLNCLCQQIRLATKVSNMAFRLKLPDYWQQHMKCHYRRHWYEWLRLVRGGML